MNLPSPYDQLGGCLWLPRILAKARLINAGQLPQEYVTRFCAATGVDGHFITFFSITREGMLEAAHLDDGEALAWFMALPIANEGTIREWNHIAVNLGRPGFPMDDRLEVAKQTTYRHLEASQVETIFQLLEMDEAVVVPA